MYVDALRSAMVRVMAQGKFDILHPGHVHYLAESAALGVGLTNLYMVGITVAAAGHAGIRARELLGQ